VSKILFTCWVNTAQAHGLPWDLWLVNLDGTEFEQLTKIGADSPYPAWSPDGKYIAFMGFSGFYVVNRETKDGYLISMNGGHGLVDWR
jgi:Tol biopolymer transport system component